MERLGSHPSLSDDEPIVIVGLTGRPQLQSDHTLSRMVAAALRQGARSIHETLRRVRASGGRGSNARLYAITKRLRRALGTPAPSEMPTRWRRARLSPFLRLGDLPDPKRWDVVRALITPTWDTLDRAEAAVGLELLRSATASFDGQRAWIWGDAGGPRFRMPIRVQEMITCAHESHHSGVLPTPSPEPIWTAPLPLSVVLHPGAQKNRHVMST